VYVAADYCGVEILKIKDTSNIVQVGWWNPWKCETSANTWFNSPGYANEIEFDINCRMLFISAGRSDMMAVSVANPMLPDSCSDYGIKTSSDTMGTWGLGRYGNQLYLAYMSTWPFYVPFTSKWSGLKIFTYNNSCTTGIAETSLEKGFELYPNPTNGNAVTFFNKYGALGKTVITVRDSKGVICYIIRKDFSENLHQIDLDLSEGLYFVSINSQQGSVTKKLVINK
jgi:hypothetical protein